MVVAHKHIDDVTENVTVFFLVFNMARGFENVCKIFRITQVKATKTVQQELFTSKKSGETEEKRIPDHLKMSKLKEILTTVAIVSYRYEKLAVLKMFSRLFCF